MPQAYNYLGMVPQQDLAGNFLRGLQIAGAVNELGNIGQAKQRQQEYQTELQGALQSNDPRAMLNLTIKYPEFGKPIKDALAGMKQDQRDAELAATRDVFSAMSAGKVDLAKSIIDRHITANQNAGRDVSSLTDLRSLADTDPNALKQYSGLLMATLAPKEFSENLDRFSQMSRREALLPGEVKKGEGEAAVAVAKGQIAPEREQAEVGNIQSQIDERAGRLGLDRDKLLSEMQIKLLELKQKGLDGILDHSTKKEINTAVSEAAVNRSSASRMEDLANQLAAQKGAWGGAYRTAAEFLKGATGNQDAYSELRKDYVRLRASELKALLPSGPASDTDVKNALAGFPSEDASPAQIASFLRGFAKLQRYNATMGDVKAEWMTANGHLGRTSQDITVAGTKVPAGTNFSDFTKKYLSGLVAQETAQGQQAGTQGRSYMRFAQPPR